MTCFKGTTMTARVICILLLFACLAAATETVLLVDYGGTSSGTTYGLKGWNTVFRSGYTAFCAYGPGGLCIVTGSTAAYNYQGIDGNNRYQNAAPRDYMFRVGDKILVTWYNNTAGAITFTPRICFDHKGSYSGGGTWLDMSEITVAAAGTGVSEYTFDATWAGMLSYVNVNCGYGTNNGLTLDKIEWVKPDPGMAAATALFTHGTEPLTVNFNGSGSTGTIVSYDWDFGDGNTASGTQAQHTYTGPGVYYPVLTVTDNTGTIDFIALTITVEPDMTYDFSNLPRSGLQPTGDFLYFSAWNPLYGTEEWEIKAICQHEDGHLGTFTPGQAINFSSNVGRAAGVESISSKGQLSWKIDVELHEMSGEDVKRILYPSSCAD